MNSLIEEGIKNAVSLTLPPDEKLSVVTITVDATDEANQTTIKIEMKKRGYTWYFSNQIGGTNILDMFFRRSDYDN